MPDETTILSLPLILPAQAQKHVTHNEAIAALDLIVQLAVIDRTLTTPPALPALGDRHIVAVGATGPWVGQAGRIALYTATGWQFTQPLAGWQAHVLAEGQTAVFDGLVWEALSDGPLTVTQLGVSATADATNRLSVSSPAVLLNHAGAGHQLKLNKAAAGNTASLLFQTGFGGRAEMGTAGSDDFSVKVSADGATWFTALESEAASGEITLPQPVHLGGQAADPGTPADGTLWLNTTSGEVKVRSAGATVTVGGGGVSDGDKGDITVSGAGTAWSIDAGAVTLAKLADIATDSFIGRDAAGTGVPEALTPAQARGILNVADGATANASDAALRDRATHTGTQAAATITGLAAVATSGSATDLSAGTLPAARFDDTAHGARAGGTLHAAASGVAAGFMSAADKTKLDAITGTNTGDQTITLTGDVTGSGTGSFATTIAADAVGNDKLANMAFGTIKARVTAGSGNPENASGTEVTALLDTFTTALKGLVPASGGGTANFLRADGTWAAPSGGGGGSPGGASGEIQFNNGGAFDGAADVEIEGGQLRLSAIATPAAPGAGGVKLFGRDVGGRILPAIIGPSGLDTSLQPFFGRNKMALVLPPGNGTGINQLAFTVTATGTATTANVSTTNRHTYMRRLDYLVTTASTTAIAGFRNSALQWTLGAPSADNGGFHLVVRWGPATGVANANHRAFVGMRGSASAPTDVNPSTLTNMCGMGYDAGDANVQFMYNDGSGTATKIDLGASFPKPSSDRTAAYEIALFAPPGTVQSLTYEVRDLGTGATASGTVTTDLPATSQLLTVLGYMSVGGTSSVVGISLMGLYIESDY
ncbi:MAG TPA: DUF2793 domain-containing protein [Tabrizicola sp.]|nr:DUF2793 domain-containing protein [Tabrizicola sp.]